MKELTLKKVRAASCFGLITDVVFFLFNTKLLAKRISDLTTSFPGLFPLKLGNFNFKGKSPGNEVADLLDFEFFRGALGA